MDKIQLDFFNKELGKKYGKTIDGRNHFRLVWSEDLTEIRHGQFLEEHPITVDDKVITIESVVERTKEIWKYHYIHERYILEELLFGRMPNDIKNVGNGSYEPLFVFQNEKFESIIPTMEACDMIIYYRFNKTLVGHRPTEEELIRKRRAHFREQLDEEIPYTTNKMVHGDGVFIDSTKKFEEKEEKCPQDQNSNN